MLGGGNTLDCQGISRLSRVIIGKNNRIIINSGTIIRKGRLHIFGNNNQLKIGTGCSIGPDCTFFMVGNNLTIDIGDLTTFTRNIEVNAQESNMSIKIGKDCMLSNNIIIRTSDSHPIFNNDRQRLNPPKSIIIGNHVWIAPNTKIMKGSKIGDGAIIGSDTTITHTIPPNALAVGRPAKIVKEDVHWTRDTLI